LAALKSLFLYIAKRRINHFQSLTQVEIRRRKNTITERKFTLNLSTLLKEDQTEKLKLKEGSKKKNRYMLVKIVVVEEGSEEVIRVFITEILASQSNMMLK